MTNDKPASDGGADERAILKERVAVFNARVEQWSKENKACAAKASELAAACFEGMDLKAPAPKKSLWFRFRSAVSGLFVSKKHAEAHPDTTIRERAD